MNKYISDEKISVIIPAYNIAPYIERCVDSVLKQSYNNFEILLVDDGSTDGTSEICDKLAQTDNRIIVFHKKNGGVSSARNLALENITGDFVSIIDGDDWIEPQLFTDAVNTLKQHNAQVFMYEYFVDKESTATYHSVDPKHYGALNNETAVEKTISPVNRFLWSKIFDAKLIGETRFDENIILGEDTLFIEEIIYKSEKVYYSSAPYYHYAIRENSACTSEFNIKKMSGLVAYDKILKICDNAGFNNAKDFATEAIIELAISLCRQAQKSKYKTQAYKNSKKYIKSLFFSAIFSKNITVKTKLKALTSVLSINLTVAFCELLGEKN